MSQSLEIEFKNILTKEEYYKIINYFKLDPSSVKKQENIYFDTTNLDLQKRRIALRSRIKTNDIEFTLKEEKEKEIIETTDIISPAELNDFISEQKKINGDVFKRLEQLGITEPLYELAALTTYRYEFTYKDALIALDKSEYYDNTDYEIELEANDYEYGKKLFDDLLNNLDIKKRIAKHKIIRAYEYKKTKAYYLGNIKD